MDEYLYKYYSFDEKGHSISNLEGGKIVFNNFSKFNDPFEGVGAYNFIETEEESQFWESIEVDINKNLGKRMSEDHKEAINFYYRISCFTETYTNPLMWSHYANSHEGFCVGYLKSDVESICENLDKIKYCDNMPTAMVSNEKFNIYDRFNELLYSKSTDWSYENEWRASYNITKKDILSSSIEEYLNKVEDNDFIHFYYGMPGMREYIKAPSVIMRNCKAQIIYIGLRTKQENRELLIKIAKEQNIEYDFMRMENGKYEFISS